MFFPDRSAKVYIATGVTDMRKFINGLSLLVAGQLDVSPLSGALFCFCNKQRNLIKILYWDRNGFCLCIYLLIHSAHHVKCFPCYEED